ACSSLTAVVSPSSVTNIGDYAFGGCNSLKTIYVDAGGADRVKQLLKDSGSELDLSTLSFVEKKADGGPYKEVVDGIEWTFVVGRGEAQVGTGSWNGQAISTSTKGAITIPSILGGCPVTRIGISAFEGCVGITLLTIPSSVTSIGKSALYECAKLSDIVVATDNPNYMSANGCILSKDGLKLIRGPSTRLVTIPSSVTSIRGYAFAYCSGLTSVTIPSSVTSIGVGAFDGCYSLATIYVEAGDADRVKQLLKDSGSELDFSTLSFVEKKSDGGPYKEVVDGVEWTYTINNGAAQVGTGLWEGQAIPASTTGAITIPSILGGCPVTSIGECAFYDCSGLTLVTIPEG
ncbi:MAG: leucine-rich repeat domain-containing protein, partial [Limosilactobacillus sp.]|nr:leucine-rich repeat domain-containing protein [Limosilactobacillus sp.]